MHTPESEARSGVVPVLRDRWDILLVIGAGGALGSIGRWSLAELVPHAQGRMPWATGIANVSGAFVLGALMVFLLDVWPPHRYARPFLGTGVLGGYTTFSTAMLDVRTLFASGHPGHAVGYLFGTLVSVLVAVWAGILLARTGVATLERWHQRRRAEPVTGSGAEPDAVEEPSSEPNPNSDPNPDAASRSPR